MKYIIYKISIADYTYIGSTKDWKQRQNQHKFNFFNQHSPLHNVKLYQTIRENGGWHAIDKTPIEEYECEGATQAHIREEHWRREYNATMNVYRAHITKVERIEYHTAYTAANKKTLSAYGSEKIECECGCVIARSAKSNHTKSKKHADLLATQQQNIASI